MLDFFLQSVLCVGWIAIGFSFKSYVDSKLAHIPRMDEQLTNNGYYPRRTRPSEDIKDDICDLVETELLVESVSIEGGKDDGSFKIASTTIDKFDNLITELDDSQEEEFKYERS